MTRMNYDAVRPSPPRWAGGASGGTRTWCAKRDPRRPAGRSSPSAVDLFNEIGYPATGLGDIIERAEMTKGALYYHFDSKESLATAIIEEGSAHLDQAFRSITQSSAPTLESMIHGVFVVADMLQHRPGRPKRNATPARVR